MSAENLVRWREQLYYVALRRHGEALAARLVALVRQWPVARIAPSEKDLLLAGRFKAFYRLSLADAVIAATARNRSATLVHKDPELAALAGELELESLAFKGAR